MYLSAKGSSARAEGLAGGGGFDCLFLSRCVDGDSSLLAIAHEICGRVHHPDSRADRGGRRMVLDGRRYCTAFSQTTCRANARKKIGR